MNASSKVSVSNPNPGVLPSPSGSERSALPSYADSTGWQAYQSYFPARMRCSAEEPLEEEWWSWRGLSVHLDRMPLAGAKAKILVVHGAGSYGRMMAPCSILARRYGYETLAPDLPGYGLTKVPCARMDYPLWIDCLTALIDLEHERDGRPIILFGVSLGGLLSYQAAARSKKVVGLAVTTLADLRERDVRRDFARYPWLGTAGFGVLESLSALTDRLPLPMPLMSKMDRISNDPTLSALCTSDPLGGASWVPARFLRTLATTPLALEPEAFDVCPVLLAHPGADRMTDIAGSRRFFDRLACDKRMVVLENAGHMPIEHPGIDQLESEVITFFDRIAAGFVA